MVKMIYRTLEIMPFGTNCYLVASEQTREGMVIDPAGDAPIILSNIRGLNLKIGLVVATHAHADHIGVIGQVAEYTGEPVLQSIELRLFGGSRRSQVAKKSN